MTYEPLTPLAPIEFRDDTNLVTLHESAHARPHI
jgi:hypothetical protein